MTATRWRVLLLLGAVLQIGAGTVSAIENFQSAGGMQEPEKLPSLAQTVENQRFKQEKPQDGPIQKKACDGLVCSLDKPVIPGDLLVVIGDGGCDPNAHTCNTVADDLANGWQIAEAVPNDNGTILWYAITATGGMDTFRRSVGFSGTIVAEYPPALSLDGANYGTYSFQNVGDA